MTNAEVYREAVANGCSERLAEMLALGRPPQIRTEATFQAKDGGLGGAQFSDAVREHYLGAARAAGVSTEGKVYDSRLAAFPGDPEAWIANQDDARRLLERRGWSCDGDITVRGPDVEPKAGPAVAEDIVAGEVAERLEADPGARPEDVRERVIAERKPHWAD